MSCSCGRPIKAKGRCNACYEKHYRDTHPEYAERKRAYHAEWLERPGNKERCAEQQREARSRKPLTPAQRRTKIARQYRLTLEEYDSLMAEPCGICGERSKHMDHCHASGVVRGGLCHRCNLGLGYLEGWFAEHHVAARAWVSRFGGDPDW